MITVRKQDTLNGAERFGSCNCCNSSNIAENYQILIKNDNGFGVDVRLCKRCISELKEILDRELPE